MNYRVELFAANDHTELQRRLNAWFRYERPRRVLTVRFVADGSEFTYCVLVLCQWGHAFPYRNHLGQ